MLHNAESKFRHLRYRNQKFPHGDNLDKIARSLVSDQQTTWKLGSNLRESQAWNEWPLLLIFNHPSTSKQPSNLRSVLKIAISVMGKSVQKLMIFKINQIELWINCIF